MPAPELSLSCDSDAMEQQRHPALPEMGERDREGSEPDRAIAEDDDLIADQRAMDQARALAPVVQGHAIDATDHDPLLGL
jgi:type IV secretion system protein VirD4